MNAPDDYLTGAVNEIAAGLRFNDHGHLDAELRCYARAAVLALLAVASAVDDCRKELSEMPRER